MGFTAPSASEVYGYLFAGRSSRRLTDRFSWSILLLNDYAPTCAELLDRHAEELCARTADRVRFVFFTDVPQERLDAPARDDAGRMTGSAWLRAVLDLMSGRRKPQRFDF